jgi:hypothetical protein
MKYHLAAYYGPGGRHTSAGKPNRRQRVGEREGDLAFQTWHLTESSRDIEKRAAESRKDIGPIHTWESDE